jgi:hypothetical protein
LLSAECADFLLIQYEKLLSDPAHSLARICNFLRIDAADIAISSAVQNCSIDRLRSKEQSERSTWQPMKNAELSGLFFREGGVGNWDALDSSLLEKMYKKWGGAMETLNYLR